VDSVEEPKVSCQCWLLTLFELNCSWPFLITPYLGIASYRHRQAACAAGTWLQVPHLSPQACLMSRLRMSQQRDSLPRTCKTLWSPAEFKGRRLVWAGGLLSTVSSNIKLESDYESEERTTKKRIGIDQNKWEIIKIFSINFYYVFTVWKWKY
jgi:hypothetical protein